MKRLKPLFSRGHPRALRSLGELTPEERSHLARCRECRERLDREQTLTLLLESLARESQDSQAPAALEQRLLASFEAESGRQREKRGIGVFRGPAFKWITAGAAAAAVVVLALLWTDPSVPLDSLRQASPAGSPGGQPEPSARVAASAPATPGPQEEARDLIPRTEPASPAKQPVMTAAAGPDRPASGDEGHPAPPSPPSPAEAPVPRQRSEAVTDFFRLAPEGAWDELVAGHLVRVELPREVLINFGLPMNPERAGQPVRADLLVGPDGLAYAVRFVN